MGTLVKPKRKLLGLSFNLFLVVIAVIIFWVISTIGLGVAAGIK
jgi:hypothetical protein